MGIRKTSNIVVKNTSKKRSLAKSLELDFSHEEKKLAGRQLFDIIYNSYPDEISAFFDEHPEFCKDFPEITYDNLKNRDEFFTLPETSEVLLGIQSLEGMLINHNPLVEVNGEAGMFVNLRRDRKAIAMIAVEEAILISYLNMNSLVEDDFYPYAMAQLLKAGNGYEIKILFKDDDGNIVTTEEGLQNIINLLQLMSSATARRIFLQE